MPCSSTWVVTRYSPTGDRATLEAGESTTKQSRSLEAEGEGPDLTQGVSNAEHLLLKYIYLNVPPVTPLS